MNPSRCTSARMPAMLRRSVPRLKYMVSACADTFCVRPNSEPQPTVQPTLVLEITLGGASDQGHDRGLRTGVTHEPCSIPHDRCSALHVHQEPIPIGVSDPSGRCGQPGHVDLAVVEEAVRTRPGAERIGPAQGAFDAEDPFPDLIVVSNLAAAEDTGKVRVGRRAGADGRPARGSPGRAQMPTDVEAGPVVHGLYCGGLVDGGLADHGSPGRSVGDELVAKAAIHAPALDVVSRPIIAAQITQPARVHDLRRRRPGRIGHRSAGR